MTTEAVYGLQEILGALFALVVILSMIALMSLVSKNDDER